MSACLALSANGLLRIINDILDFSNIEAGKMTLAVGDLDLRTLVERTVDTLLPKARAKGIELLAYVAPEVSPLPSGAAANSP